MNIQRPYTLVFLSALLSAVSMIVSSCSSPTLMLDRRASAEDRAALFHAVQDKEVVVTTLRDPATNRTRYTATEFSLDLDSARFVDKRTSQRVSIPTSHVVYIDCATCARTYVGTGVAIGSGSGLLLGSAIGLSIDASQAAIAGMMTVMTLGAKRYETPPSSIPVSMIIGTLVGAGIGAVGGSGARQPSTTWILTN
jgi:hypothetical protein